MNELKELEKKRYYQECLIRSLESKLDRIEPFSADFDDTMDALYKAIDTIKEIGLQMCSVRLKENCPSQ